MVFFRSAVAPSDTRSRNQYSIERLCALQAYIKSTSALRILSVCSGTVIASLLPVLVLDAMPLQRPEDGWDKNQLFWYRWLGGTFLTVSGGLFQMQAIAPAAELTLWKCVRIGLFVSSMHTAFAILLASLWVFPIPFMMVLNMPVWLLFFLIGTVLTLGVNNLRQNAALKTQLMLYARRLHLEACLVFFYSVYSVVFASLDGWTQVVFLFVLPIMKYAIKRIMKRTVAELEDLVPVVIITVDLFNALYQSKCMQNSTSVLATIGIIGIDVIQNIISLYDLIGYMREMEVMANDDIFVNGAITTALDIASEPTQLAENDILGLQVASHAHFRLPETHTAMVERIRLRQSEARRLVRGAAPSTKNEHHASSETGFRRGVPRNAIHHKPLFALTAFASRLLRTHNSASASPGTHTQMKISSRTSGGWARIFPGTAVQPADTVIQLSRNLGANEKAVVLKRTLELLWRCELILLVEYIEAAIPTLYAVYLVVLKQLPSAKYYPGMETMDTAQLGAAVTRILVYCALELLSLVFLHLVLKHRFKLSPLHQLAFTLESEYLLVQGSFMAWTIVILQFTLMHHGVDFTFQFSWM